MTSTLYDEDFYARTRQTQTLNPAKLRELIDHFTALVSRPPIWRYRPTNRSRNGSGLFSKRWRPTRIAPIGQDIRRSQIEAIVGASRRPFDGTRKPYRTRQTLTNLERIDRLLSEFSRIAPPQAAIFGSAAIVLRGVDLRRDIRDLDIFVSRKTFDALATGLILATKADGTSALKLPNADVEILYAFPGVEYTQVYRNASAVDGSQGLRVACLEDLAAWKRAQGRAKDMADLACIEAFQAANAPHN